MVVTDDFGCRNMVVTDDFGCRNMVVSDDFGCRNMVVSDDFGCRNMVVTYDILTTQWSSLGRKSSLSFSESSQCRKFQSRKSLKSSLRRIIIAKISYFFSSCLSCCPEAPYPDRGSREGLHRNGKTEIGRKESRRHSKHGSDTDPVFVSFDQDT